MPGISQGPSRQPLSRPQSIHTQTVETAGVLAPGYPRTSTTPRRLVCGRAYRQHWRVRQQVNAYRHGESPVPSGVNRKVNVRSGMAGERGSQSVLSPTVHSAHRERGGGRVQKNGG
jgi:hypothetical protein